MKLIDVRNARFGPHNTVDCLILADLGSGPEELQFSLVAEDTEGLSSDVREWFSTRPEFPISPALEMDLNDRKRDAKISVIEFADKIADQVTSDYPRAESDAFVAKKLEAKEVVATGSIENANLLKKVCSRVLDRAQGAFTEAELLAAVHAEAAKVLAKAEVFENVSAATQDLRKLASATIDACENAEQIDTALQQLQLAAEAELATILGG